MIINYIKTSVKEEANREAILNLYPYFSDFVPKVPEGTDLGTLCEIIRTLDTSQWNDPSGESSWVAIESKDMFLKAIQNTYPEMKEYKLMSQVTDLKGMAVSIFQRGENNYSVAYRGTGTGEWIDDGEALSGIPESNTYYSYDKYGNIIAQKEVQSEYVSDQQAAALNWFEKMSAKYGWTEETDLVVSGHSKGGNNAQIVTMYSGLVDTCISLDGEGFSPEAINQFREQFGDAEYEKRIQKMHSFAAYEDYVNVAGDRLIPKNQLYFFEAPNAEGNFQNNHCPYIYLNDNGQFNTQCEQGEISKSIQQLSERLMALPPEERANATLAGMFWAQLLVGKDTPVNGDTVSTTQIVAGTGDLLYEMADSDTLINSVFKDYNGDKDSIDVDNLTNKFKNILLLGASVLAKGEFFTQCSVYLEGQRQKPS